MSNNTVDRRSTIIEIIQSKGKLRVEELRKKFDVSNVTLRNDLKKLEEDGHLRRTHGGALKRLPLTLPLSKRKKNSLMKKRESGERQQI